jgi:methylated-DNA-[protein]-cysteine S-methyltransferase
MSENREKGVGCRGYSRGMSSTTTGSPGLTRAQRRADLGPLGPAPTHLIRVGSPIGRLEVTSDGESITGLTIERGGHLPWDAEPERSAPVLERAKQQLEEYFAGTRQRFELPLAARGGTEFQRAIWSEIDKLPFGEVSSYGELGLATGRLTAGRAVGGAVGANPIPIIVPCHRVLATNRRITGYSGGEGIPTKSWLLAHEGIEHVA